MATPSHDVVPVSSSQTSVQGPNYRFTVLTGRLIRCEWAEDGQFEDRPSTFAINRDFAKTEFDVVDSETSVQIITEHLHLTYDKKRFSSGGLTIEVKSRLTEWGSLWRYGIKDGSNLGGTARTLDDCDGRCDLGEGLLAKKGFVAVDDSSSMLFEDDFVAPRRPGDRIDTFLFGYAHDYKAAIKAFFKLSGKQPVLPRWALGNWWSRYHPYSHDEYLKLMDDFRDRSVPLSVAVIDMDWHVVDDAPHAGWTGYTWNKKLFPDPAKFGQDLHDRGLKITLNDHPHEGVHHHEDTYEEVAKALGYDASKKLPIAFDATDPKYMRAYLDIVLRDLEKKGCDFWWVDWQQGTHSKVEGFDPLWVLNHFHFEQNKKSASQPLIFSRYAGLGSHRYPVGFSGDTVTTWDSLKFQPEFTATASNVGYGWWSHDIGGHINGIRKSELFARWVQLGVFSPILRLHSTKGRWISKEPWLYKDGAIIEAFMRLRHRLVPFLYTEMLESRSSDETLIKPMYWEFPELEEAYQVPNQYFFGRNLIVSPIVEPNNLHTGLGRANVWLPPGTYVDFFTGTVYDGDRRLEMWRSLDALPVLAKKGSIIPLDGSDVLENDCRNPSVYEVVVVIGSDAWYALQEESAEGYNTSFNMEYDQQSGKLTLKCDGEKREWCFRFIGITTIQKHLKVTVDGEEPSGVQIGIQDFQHTKCLTVNSLHSSQQKGNEIVIDLGPNPELSILDDRDRIEVMLREYEGELTTKNALWKIVEHHSPINIKVGDVMSLGLDTALTGPILELLLADQRVPQYRSESVKGT